MPKKSYISSLIVSSASNPRPLWNSINYILHRTTNNYLPACSLFSDRPQLFATNFSNKISKLHFNLETNPSPTPAHHSSPSPLLLLSRLLCYPTTLIEITNVLSQSYKLSCDFNPIPTTVLKNIASQRLPSQQHFPLPSHDLS